MQEYFETPTASFRDADTEKEEKAEKQKKKYTFKNPFDVYKDFLKDEKEFLDSSLISPSVIAMFVIAISVIVAYFWKVNRDKEKKISEKKAKIEAKEAEEKKKTEMIEEQQKKKHQKKQQQHQTFHEQQV